MPHLQVQTRNSPERQQTTATLHNRPNFSLALSRFRAVKIPPFPWHWREASLHGHALPAATLLWSSIWIRNLSYKWSYV